ncbi:MAG TPA: magnesium/cobalt transporter CorA [Methylophilaceae bacterium]|nr:magnesium/cobalt transporter CorA [Methylophilaceae bacterium]
MKKPVAEKKPKQKRSTKAGLAPGSLVYVGEVKTKKPVITLIEYTADSIEEKTMDSAAVATYKRPPKSKVWLNIHGLHDTQIIADVGAAFNLHPLVLEDILNTGQRPKVDVYDDYLYIVTRSFYYDKTENGLESEQISLVLGEHTVLTFQERPTGSFEPVRERLRSGRGNLRGAGPDYLAYALLDVIVDRYFIMLEQIGDDSEMLENVLLRKPTSAILHKIHRLKREIMELRRCVWPLREVLNGLIRNENKFFEANTLLYLRDVYDHTVHFIESLESIRDMLGGMLEIYLSSLSNRLNMELRALTVVAMLFMPATLIASIFGMNFNKMPWINHDNGFWWAIAIMAGVAFTMGLIFWRHQWLSRR